MEVRDMIDRNKSEGLIVLGDFNAHLHMLEDRKEDANGDMILQLIEDYDLTLLNADERCEGVYTWQARGQRSAIDMIMVNRKVYESCGEIVIDEGGNEVNFSDHNVFTVGLNLRERGAVRFDREENRDKWENRVRIRTDKDSMDNFIDLLRERWQEGMWFGELWDILVQTQDEVLKISYRARVGFRKGMIVVEGEWVDDELREGVKKRREINRKRRNSIGEERTQLEQLYRIQKAKVQVMVREKKGRWELKKIEQAKDSKDHGKTIWKAVRELNGKTKSNTEDIVVLDGVKTSVDKAWGEVVEGWSSVLFPRENNVMSTWEGGWGEGLKDRYKQEIRDRDNLREHLDMARQGDLIEVMEWDDIEEQEILDSIRNLDDKTAGGPDRVKGKLLKEIIKDDRLKNLLVQGYKGVIRDGRLPSSWSISNTTLVKKKEKPTVKDFRPIAVNSIGYKLFWGAARVRMEEQMVRYGLVKFNQFGFTKGGRLDYNHFLLQFLVERTCDITRKYYKNLVVIALDFKKAFDSINRGKLIEILVKYRMNPLLIDLVSKIYTGDRTILRLGGKEAEIKVSSGIRQGCTSSTFFFKIITFVIMERLEEIGIPFEVDGIKINSLWYCDDSNLIANSVAAARTNIRIVKEVGRGLGLEINEDKSKALVFKKGIKDRYIEGIEVVNKIKYLGLEITSDRDLFKEQRKIIIRKAEHQSCRVRSNIERGFNKLEIGKLWWKNGVMMSVLVGIGVISLYKYEIDKLQRLENGVYRQLLGGRKFTPIAILRGEVGSSMVRSRVIQARLILVKSIVEGDNTLLKQVLEVIMRVGRGRWYSTLMEYLGDVGMTYDELIRMDRSEIKIKVRNYDNKEWYKNLSLLTDREVYRKFKRSVGRSYGYDNRMESDLLFRARSNSLDLNDFRRHNGGETKCDLCGADREDLVHFTLVCPSLDKFRNKDLIEKIGGPGNGVDRVGNLLFNKANIETVKKMLGTLWRERNILLIRKNINNRSQDKKGEKGGNLQRKELR